MLLFQFSVTLAAACSCFIFNQRLELQSRSTIFCGILELSFFSGTTDFSEAETLHNKPLKKEGCVAFAKLSCSLSLACQLEHIQDFIVYL